MKGSTKQINWANEIIEGIERRANKLIEKRPDHPRTANYKKAAEILPTLPHAKWVIKFNNEAGVSEIDEYVEWLQEKEII